MLTDKYSSAAAAAADRQDPDMHLIKSFVTAYDKLKSRVRPVKQQNLPVTPESIDQVCNGGVSDHGIHDRLQLISCPRRVSGAVLQRQTVQTRSKHHTLCLLRSAMTECGHEALAAVQQTAVYPLTRRLDINKLCPMSSSRSSLHHMKQLCS